MLFHLLQNIFYGLNMKFLELHSTEASLPQRKHYIAKNNYHNIHVFVCFLFLPMHFTYLSYSKSLKSDVSSVHLVLLLS